MENTTATIVINNVDFTNIPMDIIDKMLAQNLVYLGEDGKYHKED